MIGVTSHYLDFRVLEAFESYIKVLYGSDSVTLVKILARYYGDGRLSNRLTEVIMNGGERVERANAMRGKMMVNWMEKELFTDPMDEELENLRVQSSKQPDTNSQTMKHYKTLLRENPKYKYLLVKSESESKTLPDAE